MRTIRRDWQELRSCAVVMLLIAGVSATTVSSCGGGGGGDSNGELCQQCGDSDGPCVAGLLCARKLGSAQRRCFPLDPETGDLDLQYRCDGSRPNPDGVPTITPTPTPTFTASASPTPTSTGPTATGVTATPTGSTPTPTPTATPEDVTVTITIGTDDDDFTVNFTVTVTYPADKGNFRDGAVTDCDPEDGLTPEDNGSGTLTLTFPADSARTFSVDVDCTFHQDAGQTLVQADLVPSVSSPSLTVEIDPL